MPDETIDSQKWEVVKNTIGILSGQMTLLGSLVITAGVHGVILREMARLPTRLRIKVLGVEWNMHVKINPFRFRVRSIPTTNEVDF